MARLTVLHVLGVVLDLDGHSVEMELSLEAGAGHLQHSLGICILSWGKRHDIGGGEENQRPVYLSLGAYMSPSLLPTPRRTGMGP